MDARVTVIETSTGKKLTGEDAPTRKELEKWLSDNPGLVTHITKHFPYTWNYWRVEYLATCSKEYNWRGF